MPLGASQIQQMGLVFATAYVIAESTISRTSPAYSGDREQSFHAMVNVRGAGGWRASFYVRRSRSVKTASRGAV